VTRGLGGCGGELDVRADDHAVVVAQLGDLGAERTPGMIGGQGGGECLGHIPHGKPLESDHAQGIRVERVVRFGDHLEGLVCDESGDFVRAERHSYEGEGCSPVDQVAAVCHT